ncbi:MAG: Ig-like domain-containing protein, partial [Candidatus Thorarchaeota archaeon]
MYRKQKVCLVGLSFALFLLLISTATPGATTSIVEFSAIEHPQPQFSNSLVNLPPPPGMVSYWEFNEGNGGLAADSVGRNDGTLRDGGIWVPGVAGAALDLAPRAYVDCGGDISLTIDDSLTIEAWVLLPNPYGIRTIVQNGANPTNKMYHFAIEDGFLYFDRFDGTTSPANVVRSHLRVTPGEWHHVVVLMDAVGHSVTFYVDGDMDTIGGFFDPYTGVPYSRFIIGYGQDPMTGHSPTFFNGLIDEVAVYAALLSDENIQQHYQNGLNGLGYLEGGIEPPAIEATDDSYTTDEDVLLDVSAPGVLANDIGDGITAILEAGPLAGSLTLNGDGSFEYIPVPDFNGVDTFIYSVSDGFEESNNATVTITVNAVNDAPVGVDDGYTIDEDTSLDLAAPGILENDYDVDGDALLAALIDAPLHGAVVLNADGSLSYVPDADWHGTDSLTYQVFDGTDYSGLVTVTVEVEPVGDAPRAQDDSYTTEENIPLIIDALSGVLVNDSDPDDDLLASQIITFPSHGSLDFNVDGSFTYTPDPDWYGVDSFVYEALDGIFTDTATVTITVLPANKPPVASDDFYTTNEDVVLDVDAMNGVLANDNDINGDFLTAVLLSGPTHGSLSLNADGSFTYTPDPNWYGTDSFAYEVSDGELTDNAIVIITVNSVNDAPVAKADAYTTDEDVPLNIPAPGILGTDSDIEGSILEALLLTDVSHGILTLFADGSFVYEPNPDFFGIDSFAYTAFDGELESNVATVTITVTAVNDAPVAVDDFYSTDEDTDLSTHGAGIAGVVANDIDADGDLLVAILMDIPIHGSLAFDPDGNFLYIPDADFWGTDWFTYYLYDDLEFSDSATVTITVNPINDAPIADDDIYATNEDTPLVVPAPGILAGDTDVDGDSLIAVLLMGP